MLNFLNWYHEKCFSATRTDIEILEVIIIRLNKKYKIKYNNIFQAKTSPPPQKKKKNTHSASLKVLHDIIYNYLLTKS